MLRDEAHAARPLEPRPRQRDSKRRAALKWQRWRQRRSTDNAERDTNHAIAHSVARRTAQDLGSFKAPVARFAPGENGLEANVSCDLMGRDVTGCSRGAWPGATEDSPTVGQKAVCAFRGGVLKLLASHNPTRPPPAPGLWSRCWVVTRLNLQLHIPYAPSGALRPQGFEARLPFPTRTAFLLLVNQGFSKPSPCPSLFPQSLPCICSRLKVRPNLANFVTCRTGREARGRVGGSLGIGGDRSPSETRRERGAPAGPPSATQLTRTVVGWSRIAVLQSLVVGATAQGRHGAVARFVPGYEAEYLVCICMALCILAGLSIASGYALGAWRRLPSPKGPPLQGFELPVPEGSASASTDPWAGFQGIAAWNEQFPPSLSGESMLGSQGRTHPAERSASSDAPPPPPPKAPPPTQAWLANTAQPQPLPAARTEPGPYRRRPAPAPGGGEDDLPPPPPIVVATQGPLWHYRGCTRVRGKEAHVIVACRDCNPGPDPTGFEATFRGRAWHRSTCGHITGRVTRILERCHLCHAQLFRRHPREVHRRRPPPGEDDAERDTNHAIAHLVQGETSGTRGPAWGETFGMSFGVFVFLLFAGVCLFCLVLGVTSAQVTLLSEQGTLTRRVGEGGPEFSPVACSEPGDERREPHRHHLNKRVRFAEIESEMIPPPARHSPTLPRKRAKAAPLPASELRKRPDLVQVPHLQGPAGAKARWPAGTAYQFGAIGPDLWGATALRYIKARLATSTQRLYAAHWTWWTLFCARRGISPYRHVLSYQESEESLFLDFILHTSLNGLRSHGTIKMRLAAIRAEHLTVGLPNPLAQFPRIPLVLDGIKRKYPALERRHPVTPAMLLAAAELLQHERDGLVILLALLLGFFFLLRASELIGDAWHGRTRGLRGCDVSLLRGGKPCPVTDLSEADELRIFIQSSKTDIYNAGATRNHFATGLELCPVRAAIQVFQLYPQRYLGGSEQDDHLLRGEKGDLLTRQFLQLVLQQCAERVGDSPSLIKVHSLRFGGASALWSRYQNAELIKRLGRWTSNAYQSYLWESRESARGVAENMARADLTPV